jgi:hypothetical protein
VTIKSIRTVTDDGFNLWNRYFISWSTSGCELEKKLPRLREPKYAIFLVLIRKYVIFFHGFFIFPNTSVNKYWNKFRVKKMVRKAKSCWAEKTVTDYSQPAWQYRFSETDLTRFLIHSTNTYIQENKLPSI